MSVQDNVERILKNIHLLFSEGQEVSGDPDLIAVDKKILFKLLEKLNLSMYEVMDQYEATAQSRELALRKNEKRGEQIVEQANKQVEDIYAAALIYTEDAVGKVHKIMSETAEANMDLLQRFSEEIEKEKVRVKENQNELVDQLRDFKDSNKYLQIIDNCNKERERGFKGKEGESAEKRIQNEAKHYPMNVIPEIKVNPSYLQRRGITEEKTTKQSPEGNHLLPPNPVPVAADLEVKVDLDAEYFKWQAEEKESSGSNPKSHTDKKERKFLFSKK
jgi:hypothetical protein